MVKDSEPIYTDFEYAFFIQEYCGYRKKPNEQNRKDYSYSQMHNCMRIALCSKRDSVAILRMLLVLESSHRRVLFSCILSCLRFFFLVLLSVLSISVTH